MPIKPADRGTDVQVSTPEHTTPTGPTEAAASTAGGALGAASRLLTRVRSTVKPLHPTGDVVIGRLARTGGDRKSGVAWLDAVADDEVVVRISRAIGLPLRLPDIHGLALRVPADGRPADLLLASTGTGPLTRFVLTASRDLQARPLTTLLPYRSPGGPLFLGARPVTGAAGHPAVGLTFDLLWSQGLGDWVPFARLEVSSTSGADPAISFDPVVNPLPGLEFYPWVRLLREPAYRAARAASGRGL